MLLHCTISITFRRIFIQSHNCKYKFTNCTFSIFLKVLVSNNDDIWTIKRLLTVQQAAEERKAAITAEVVAHVDNSAYLKRVEQRKEAAAIKKDMDKIIKQMDDQMKYDIYAEENPELKKMLERYKELKEWD